VADSGLIKTFPKIVVNGRNPKYAEWLTAV